MWGTHSPMAEDDPSDDELMPNKFPKRAGKGAGKLDKRPREPNTALPRGPKQAHLLTLAKMLARHEMALQQLEADRSWVIFVDSGSMGIINQLMLTTATWKTQRSKNECSCGLRQAHGGNALRARSEDDQAGDRHIGPDPASEGEDPLTGPLAVAAHEVEPGEAGPRADERGAALTRNSPHRTTRTEVPHPTGGHDALIRGEGGSHALQADSSLRNPRCSG